MRRIPVVCLSLVCLLFLSLSVTTAQEILYDIPAWIKGYGAVWSVIGTPDNSRLIALTSTGLYLLNPDALDAPPILLKGHSDTIQSAAFSKDGSLAATISLDGTVRLWRIPSGEALWSARVTDPCCLGESPVTVNFTNNASLLLVSVGAHHPAGAYVVNVQSGKAQPIDSNTFPYTATVRGNDLLYGKQENDGFHVYRLDASGDDFATTPVAVLPDAQALTDTSKNGITTFTDAYAVLTTDKDTLAAVNLNDGTKPAEIEGFPPFFSPFDNTLWGHTTDSLSAINLETGARVDISTQRFLGAGSSQWVPYVDTTGTMTLLDLKTLKTTAVAPDSRFTTWTRGYLTYLDGKSIKVFEAVTAKTTVLAGAFTPDGDQPIFAQVNNNKILLFYQSAGLSYAGIWDVTTGSNIVEPQAYKTIAAPQFISDDTRYAVSAQDNSSDEWGILAADLNVGSLHFFTSRTAPGNPELFIGDRLLYRNSDYVLLDLSTSNETALFPDDYSARELAFSPDGKTLATSGTGNTVRLWDADTGAQTGVLGLQQNVQRMAYGERGIAALYDNNQLQFLNIPATAKPTNTVDGTDDLYDVALLDTTIAAAGENNVQLFALDAAGNITPKNSLVTNASLLVPRHYSVVAMSARYIAAAGYVDAQEPSESGTIIDLWSATTRKFVMRLDSPTSGDAYELSFSPDGSHMALTDSGRTVVWDLKRSLDEPAFVTSIGMDSGSAFAGNILATVEQSWLKHTITLHTASGGTYVGTLHRNLNSLGGGGGDGYRVPIAASADGSHIALVDALGELVVWNVPAQIELAAQAVVTRKADVIPYCDALGGVAVNPTQSQPVNLIWSWFATDIPHLFDHIWNAVYEIKLDGGTALSEWAFQRSTIHRDKANDNNWTVYYSFDVGMLKPGTHTVSYHLTWKNPISDGLADYGPNTAHPEDTGQCTFTVN